MADVLHDPTQLPGDLPVPQDDGGARHLTGMKLPDIALAATHGSPANLSKLKGRTVVYVYPRTGVPGQARIEQLIECRQHEQRQQRRRQHAADHDRRQRALDL